MTQAAFSSRFLNKWKQNLKNVHKWWVAIFPFLCLGLFAVQIACYMYFSPRLMLNPYLKSADHLAKVESASCSSGAIEHRDRPNTPVKYFTQADVNSGKLVYRPPLAPSHLQELYQYSFMGETAAAPTLINTLNCSIVTDKVGKLICGCRHCRQPIRRILVAFLLACGTRSSPPSSLSQQGCRSH